MNLKKKTAGFAGNPMGEAGIVAIGGGIIGSENVRQIDLSGIRMESDAGLFRVPQLIGIHQPLEWMDISAIPLGYLVGEKLLDNLQNHRNLVYLECRNCGKSAIASKLQLYYSLDLTSSYPYIELTENQERKIQILLQRNIYYKENPILLRDHFNYQDTEVIDEWIKEIKYKYIIKKLRISWNAFEGIQFWWKLLAELSLVIQWTWKSV